MISLQRKLNNHRQVFSAKFGATRNDEIDNVSTATADAVYIALELTVLRFHNFIVLTMMMLITAPADI